MGKKDKICPLRAGQPKNCCIKEKCAWWVEDAQACAMKELSCWLASTTLEIADLIKEVKSQSCRVEERQS